MIHRYRIGNYRIHFGIVQVVDVRGVNSNLPHGKHVLMWDFDRQPACRVQQALKDVQARFHLPPIFLMYSGKPGHWLVYCMKRVRFREAFQIIASTQGIDVSFLKYAIHRGKFTLRITPKCGRPIRLAAILPSQVHSDVNPLELKSFVQYESTSVS